MAGTTTRLAVAAPPDGAAPETNTPVATNWRECELFVPLAKDVRALAAGEHVLATLALEVAPGATPGRQQIDIPSCRIQTADGWHELAPLGAAIFVVA